MIHAIKPSCIAYLYQGPFASQLPTGQVTGEVPGTSAGVYRGTLAKYQEHSSETKNILKRKSSDPNPKQGIHNS